MLLQYKTQVFGAAVVTVLIVGMVVSPVAAGGDGGDAILIEDFSQPTHKWVAKNDPVMGGKSHSTVTIDDDLGIFDGEVVDVPFLQAPGFITMETRGGTYPDVSSCESIELTVRSTTDYTGYRVSFGRAHVPGNRFAFGYKSNFAINDGNENDDFVKIVIPFHNFTVRWDDATGDPIVTCDQNPKFCPDTATLQDMKSFTFWGEGVSGKVHLEIKTIQAVGCASATATTSLLEENINHGEKGVEHHQEVEDLAAPLAMEQVVLQHQQERPQQVDCFGRHASTTMVMSLLFGLFVLVVTKKLVTGRFYSSDKLINDKIDSNIMYESVGDVDETATDAKPSIV